MTEAATQHQPTPPLLHRQDHGAVAQLTLASPANRNALSEAMLAELSVALAAIAGERTFHAVVLDAQGPVFCAGHDLKQLTARRADADRGRAYFAEILARC